MQPESKKQIMLAPRVSRVINYVLDLMACRFIVSLVLAILAFNSLYLNLFGQVVLNLITQFLYYFVAETQFSRTLGKLVTKTKVINLQGEKPSVNQIIKRTLLRVIPFEPFSFLLNPIGLHDKWSQTRVSEINSDFKK